MTAPGHLLLVLLVAAPGQPGPEGVWQARYTTAEGRSHEFTLTLEASAGTLSGAISSPRGKVAITDGTVNGREVSFTVTRKSNYDLIDVAFNGSIEGDVMRLTMKVGSREPVVVTARRQGARGAARGVGVPASDESRGSRRAWFCALGRESRSGAEPRSGWNSEECLRGGPAS
jgi:hypothetical protein